MVIYDLVCANQHSFEGWFSNSEDFVAQSAVDLIACPICESCEVQRKVSAPNIGSSAATTTQHRKSEEQVKSQSNVDASDDKMHINSAPEQLEMLRTFVEKNFEDVGSDFGEEARKIHYGEAEQRAIRGEATQEVVAELEEEGISTYSLPAKPKKENMN